MMHSFDHIPIRFNKIMLASDFSAVSARALPYAAAIARRFGSTLYVTHVIPPEAYDHIAPSDRDVALAEMKRQAEKQIASQLSTSHFAGIPHQLMLDHGEVLQSLSRLVEKTGVDLIVTGTHGKHGLAKLISGSMAEEIFRLASVPVLAIGPEVAIDPQSEAHLERILFATDLSSESNRAMRYAYALASAYLAHLFFLHVVEDVWREPLSTKMQSDAFCRLQLLSAGLPESEQGIQPEFLVEFGSPETLTLEMVQKREIQLLVLNVPGTEHPALSAHLPGPLAYNVVTHARCPVLVVRGRAERTSHTSVESQSAAD